MDYLLSLTTPPTAVFCYNDMTALAALASAWRHQVSVPEQLSVVGFDDLLIASYTHPPLTTVRQPKHLMGQLAAEILLNLIAGSSTELSRRLQGELIVRESTAPPTVERSGRTAARLLALVVAHLS
jgi:DNA-binding LacI/PurR family transcriptional regulator